MNLKKLIWLPIAAISINIGVLANCRTLTELVLCSVDVALALQEIVKK